mmetsp:Transcript_24595/g.79077  ORF Transcript_24595/g.79077 Transcript_24595/m.79077 type:complete len:355 (-) Transcript_24595:107-1171(-)
MASGWCTIESDPGVFSELITELGVKGVQVHELWSLDKESMAEVGPVHGLIFLFRWRGEKDDRATVTPGPSVFFASQMIPNACATQAILSVLMNCPSISLGEEMTAFKAFTKDFPPDVKGLAISNSDLLRRVHNSFARAEPMVSEERRASKEEDEVYHFISYVPVNGKLYELDGLKAGPICLGDAGPGEAWLDAVTPAIQARIEQYSSREIRFNLMAVTADRREVLLAEQAVIEKERNMTVGKVQARAGKLPSPAELERLAASHPEPPATGEVAVDERTLEQLLIALAHLTARAAKVAADIENEQQRVGQWKIENIRRRHNYVPFIVNFLKVLAERGELGPLVEQAKKKQRHGAR